MARLMPALFSEQPRMFPMIFMLEIWERFGFYTMQGILTLYFMRYLGFSDEIAYYTFGAFSALVYSLVAVGGYLGDKILGTKRSIVLGLIVLGAGYFSLSCVPKSQVFLALGLICVGNGLFKANPSALLSQCYTENDPRLHGAFTLYYMAINLGSIFALFIGPSVSAHFGYRYAYFISGIGMLMGLANYIFHRRELRQVQTKADQRPIRLWKWGLIILGIVVVTLICSFLLKHFMLAKKLIWLVSLIVLSIYLYTMRSETKPIRQRMILALILLLEAIVFFTLYQQMPTSLNLFAVNNVAATFINPQSFQALNPIWIVLLSPPLALFYRKLNQHGMMIATPYKFAAGMTCCSLSFLILYFSRFSHNEQGLISAWWLVGSYFFQSLGELLVSALGVAMMAELVPKPIVGFAMGMWFLTSSIAGFIGASVAALTALPSGIQPGMMSLMIYTKVFAYIGLTTLTIAFALWVISPRLSRLMGP